MKFEKKLVILSGKGDAKGTVNIERNAYGTFATVNIYNIPDLRSGEYGLGIRRQEGVFTRSLGSLGRIMARFQIEDGDLSALHCVLYNTDTEDVVMYGTTASKRLWESNLMDGIRRKKVEKVETVETSPIAQAALPQYSGRPKEISDYFLDILPEGADYADDAVAEVNYYPSNLSFARQAAEKESEAPVPTEPLRAPDVAADKAEQAPPAEPQAQPKAPQSVEPQAAETEEADAMAARAEDPPAEPQTAASIETVEPTGPVPSAPPKKLPHELERDYLYRHVHRRQGAASAAQPVCPPPAEQEVAAAQTAYAQAQGEPLPAADDAPQQLRTEVRRIKEAAAYTAEEAVRGKVGAANFYEQVGEQIEALLRDHPRFALLEQRLPETRWVRVEYDNSGKYYAVGLVGTRPDFLCYAVPGTYSESAPPELEGYCSWLPEDEHAPRGKGFWLMFQDATTGESVESL